MVSSLWQMWKQMCTCTVYTHTYILNIFPNKKLFVCCYKYRNVGLTPKEVETVLRRARASLTPESSSRCTMSHIHCTTQESSNWSALIQSYFQPQIVLRSDATTKECLCTLNTLCDNILPFLLYHFYYALSHIKTSLYWLHITHLRIRINVYTDLGPNPLRTYAL